MLISIRQYTGKYFLLLKFCLIWDAIYFKTKYANLLISASLGIVSVYWQLWMMGKSQVCNFLSTQFWKHKIVICLEGKLVISDQFVGLTNEIHKNLNVSDSRSLHMSLYTLYTHYQVITKQKQLHKYIYSCVLYYMSVLHTQSVALCMAIQKQVPADFSGSCSLGKHI